MFLPEKTDDPQASFTMPQHLLRRKHPAYFLPEKIDISVSDFNNSLETKSCHHQNGCIFFFFFTKMLGGAKKKLTQDLKQLQYENWCVFPCSIREYKEEKTNFIKKKKLNYLLKVMHTF